MEQFQRTLKIILTILCGGYPCQWLHHLITCQATMNSAIHTLSGIQPFFAFYNRHESCVTGVALPCVDGKKAEMEVAHEVLQEAHAQMSWHYPTTANCNRRNKAARQGTLVWVKCENVENSTSSR